MVGDGPFGWNDTDDDVRGRNVSVEDPARAQVIESQDQSKKECTSCFGRETCFVCAKCLSAGILKKQEGSGLRRDSVVKHRDDAAVAKMRESQELVAELSGEIRIATRDVLKSKVPACLLICYVEDYRSRRMNDAAN